MRRKTALLAAVLAALLLPAPALAQTVSEGLIEVVGTLDLDAGSPRRWHFPGGGAGGSRV